MKVPSPPCDWRSEAERFLPHARFNEPMARHTTFRIGGPADLFVEASGFDELRAALRFARRFRLPLFMLGNGSKLLVADSGIRGLVLRLGGEFERFDFIGKGRVRAGAGIRLPRLIGLCAARGLGGLEPLAGIPATVGGALVMNAGTPEGEVGDLVRQVWVLDRASMRSRRLGRRSLRFGYRMSNFRGRIILGCELQLKACAKVDIISGIRRQQRRRVLTQPSHTHNIGSVFKNPPDIPAAQLIEECGLKGKSVGGARVSPRHANFIENFAGAKAADVLKLVRRIRERVLSRHGKALELEMKVVGHAEA